MANINVTFTENTITVNETTSNVTVAETVNTIVVGTTTIASNAQIRAAISANSPITYNSTTGVIGADANALFTGKTTTDLPEGANLYYTDSRVVTGIFNGNVQVKQFAETVNNNNVISGNVSFNMALGTIHKGILGGNITNITLSNIQRGGSATLILQQDNVGGHTLNSNSLTNWKFVNTNTTLDGTPDAYNILSVVYDGVDYFASLIDFGTAVSGTITINGVTIPVGGSGNLTTTNITEGANLYYTNARANTAIGAYQGSINTAGNVTANYFLGNGSLLTGVSGLTNAQVVSHIATVPLTVGGNLTVNGNINATGNINIQNVEDLYVRDQTIVMNANAASPANVQIVSNRPGFANTEIKWNEQSDRWTFTNDGTTYYNLATSTSDVAEGTNLYYTDTRANSAIGAYQGNINTPGTITGSTLSGNGSTITGLSTTQVSEGTNLYYSNARVNAFIQDNITTTDIDEGTNLYFTAARARGNISAAENITYNSGTGVIGLANALGNVNSITAELGQNHTLISDTTLLQSRVRNNSVVNAANVEGLGFAIYDNTPSYQTSASYPFISYSGTNEIKSLVFDGDATAGSNVITITNIYDAAGNTMAVSNVKQYYGFSEFPGVFGDSVTFPEGTYVTSVSGSNVYMSANALTTTTFYADLGLTGYSLGSLFPMAYDTVTGLGIGMSSPYDNAFVGDPPGSATSVNSTGTNRSSPLYAYPESGPVKADLTFPFDTANFSVASFSGVTLAKTNIGASKTVPAFTRGLTVGGGDLTSRGIGDKQNPTFGLNILWDGTANVTQEYGTTQGIFPQILLRSFSDGTTQGISGNTATSWSAGGPRLLFINGNGNANDPILDTYALANQELGKIGWTSTTGFTSIVNSLGPAAYITAISNKNQTTGPGDVGLYLVASPTTSASSTGQIGSSTARALFLAHHKANTIVSAGSRTNGTAGDIYFAPARQSSNQGNAVAMSELIVNSANGSPHWAKIGYDNPASNTGAKVSITNGFNTTSARNGNITLVLDRNDNGAGFGNKEWAFKLQPGSNSLVLTEDDVIRTTFASGGNINLATNATINYDAVYGCFHNMANVTAANADTVYEFVWPNVHINTNRVTVAGNSQITIGQEGAYVFSLEMQAENTDNQDRTAFIWLAKNGTDIAETCLRVSLLKEWKQVIVKEWIVNSLNANDYIEVRFAVDNTSGIQLTSIPAQASPYARPAVPSAVITVTPVGV